MLKILIADDEVSIILLIKKLISRDIAHQIVGETTDGKSALSMIEREKPDIVITDIRMPGLNGIEMIQAARELGSMAEFIIISGYKDFRYAQSAIRYGVLAYLLKPIKADELNSALEQVQRKQGETEKLKTRIADMEHTIAQNRITKRKEILAACVKQLISPHALLNEQPRSSLEEVFHVREGIFCVLIVKLDFDDRVEADFLAENVEAMGEKYYRAIKDDCFDLEAYCQESRYYLLFHTGDAQFRDIIRKVDALVKDKISQYNMYQVSAAIGQRVSGKDQLGYAFLSADYGIMQRLREESGTLIVYRGERNLLEGLELPEELKRRIDRALYELDEQVFGELFQKLYEDVKRWYREDPYYIRHFLEAAVGYVGMRLQSEEPQSSSLLAQKTDFCCSAEDIYQVCLKEASEQILAAGQKKKDGISRPIRSMKLYIREHYGENLSLEEIAGAAQLSYAYGSSIFKKETGMTITSYLTQVRMEEAKRLIRETNLTINEIAYKVGYTDTRYFSKLFIKAVGIKPVDYRKFYN